MIPTSWLYRLLGCALAAAALLWLVQSRDHWRDTAQAKEALFRQAQAANAATVANYRAAAERARLEDAANLARVKSELAKINERSKDEFESRIADARARAGELRRKNAGAAADSGAGRAAPVPAISLASGGAAQAAGQDRLPANDALIATEQAIQLDELIKWVRSQAAIVMAPPQATAASNADDGSASRGR